ncbi:carboxylesterase/lipase family protein [Spirosoma arcticum]
MKDFCTLLILSVWGMAAFAQPTAITSVTLVAATEAGPVMGQRLNGINTFKNIPYAAPPVDELRFAAPAKHKPWTGVRDARQTGPTAPFPTQPDGDMDGKPVFGAGWVKGDDYLTTNIWTPGEAGQRLPVMVFIHGGAFVLGTGNGPLYDGTQLAKKGVVSVSLNYRLGIEGFLKIKGVPSNLGIRDQLAALQWVRDNIAQFGGDPANVTIFGESAGAMSVGVLLVSPAAKGLFRRGIMMSGSGQAVLSGEQADRIATQYAKKLKISNTSEAYRRFSPEELLAAQQKVTPKMVKLETDEYTDPTGGLVLYLPVIDGDIIPDIPLKQVQKGTADDFDLLLGNNADEANYFLVPTGLLKKVKFNFILKKAVQRLHPAPSVLIAVYKQAYPNQNLGALLSTILTAYQFQVPTIRYADAHARQGGKTYLYEFTWKSPVANGTYGAYHGLGLPFVFNQLPLVTGPRGMLGAEGGPVSLAEQMQTAWVNFAKTGDPGSGWLPYTSTDRNTMRIDQAWQLQRDAHQSELKAWEGVR